MGNTILGNHDYRKVNLVTQPNMMDTWKCSYCNKKVEAIMGPPDEECPKNMIDVSVEQTQEAKIIQTIPSHEGAGYAVGDIIKVFHSGKARAPWVTMDEEGKPVYFMDHEVKLFAAKGPDDLLEDESIKKAVDLTGAEVSEVETSISEDSKPIPRPPTDYKEDLVKSDDVDKVKVDYPHPPEDRHYEEFAHIESWDEVVSEAADLRVEMDNKKFRLGALVNFSCPRKAGRPAGDDDRWNVSSLAASIGEDRAVLSQLASNEEFWNKDIREELPPQVSWRQLARVRVDSGWRPGKPVGTEQLQFALDGIIKIADGVYERPAKKVQKVKPERYAKRIIKTATAAQKGMYNTPDTDFGEVVDLFQTIIYSAGDIIEMLKDDNEEE